VDVLDSFSLPPIQLDGFAGFGHCTRNAWEQAIM